VSLVISRISLLKVLSKVSFDTQGMEAIAFEEAIAFAEYQP